MKIDLSTQFTGSIFAAHWSLNPSVVYRFGTLGLGAGVKSYLGIGYEAFFLGPYARLELGPFYAGAGPFFLPRQPPGDDWVTLPEALSFLGTAGLAIPIWTVGPGRLGIDAGLDVSITPSPVIETEADTIIGSIFAAFAANVAGVVLNAIKLNAGIVYTLRL